MRFFFLFFSVLLCFNSFSQGTIKGKVIDLKSRQALPFANILVEGTTIGVSSDENGEFIINNAPVGYLKIQTSLVGYKTNLSDDYLVTKEKTPFIIVELDEKSSQLSEVIVRRKLFEKPIESPLSRQTLGIAEIEKNPGGNRDILKVIQSLPGVASNPGFRNDIIIRGGAPSENKFYIDGIEIPVINHFQTQGATGGPVGIINADLIRKTDFYSSAFPANRGNTLSSVIEFTQKVGSPNRFGVRATLGTSDAGITVDGPISKNTSFIASARQSYLQFLFKLIKLPFLPTYNDFQFNVKSQLSDKGELSIIGLGAIDNFELNEDVNDGVDDEETLKRNRYILNNIPIQEQWNYTFGINYKHFSQNSKQQYILSRNVWNNTAEKFFNNTQNPSDLLLDYSSKEIENKFRFENTSDLKNNYKLTIGFNLEKATYTNETFNRIANSSGISIQDFSSELDLFKYGLFGQISKNYFNSKLGLSFGFRLDGNDYNDEMKNVLNQFSPRFSATYAINNKWSLNSSLGSYYQLPAYTILGFRDNTNTLANQSNLKYIQSNHLVLGLEFKPSESLKIALEGFHKSYKNYPFSIRDQISLANLGSDFGVIGNEQVTSISEGRSYGFEIFSQKKSYDGLYGILSYTFVISEFKDRLDNYIPSTWDNRHLLTITGGKKLTKNWELGAKFRFVGGRPFTPYDLNASSLIANYDIANRGILDYNLLNTERFKNYTQLDIRLDKTWYSKKFSLNLYIDVQNIYGSEAVEQSYLIPTRDNNGNNIIDPTDNSRYILESIENSSGTILPRFGLIVDF